MLDTFRSLRHRNYLIWTLGALVSNVGTWVQRTAQDWIVLTQLTHESATAVGIVMSLQFGPQLLLLPLTGAAADRYDRRRLLLITQSLMGLLALALGLLTIAGTVQLWHVYLLAALLGCVTAFDAPARQTFFAELVGEADLANAVALNATSFHSARMIGPALAGVLLGLIGAGWLFLMNAASFAAVLASLALLRAAEFHPQRRAAPGQGGFVDGLRYVWGRPDLVAVLAMIFMISTFGFNFQLFIPAMAVTVFHADAGEYGTLASLMAAGSVAGALYAARHARPRLRVLMACATIFGAACALAALAPGTRLFGLTLIACGVSAQIYMTSTNSLVQLSTEQSMRGRVVSLLMAIVLGCTPLGAPLVGWVSDALGPRWALAVAAASGFAAAAIGLRYLMKYARRNLRRYMNGLLRSGAR